MSTAYVIVNGSRFMARNGVDLSGVDDGNVTGWYRDEDVVLTMCVYTSKGPLASTYKLQWRNVTDDGTFDDVASTGQIHYTTPDIDYTTDDGAVAYADKRCSTVGGYSWQNGIYNYNDNTLPDTGTYSLLDERYTELQWALNLSTATYSKEYAFRLWDVTVGTVVPTGDPLGATITINSSDIEATAVILDGEETGGSPDYRNDWTNWINYPAGTAPTINNGDYGQIEGGTVASPVMRVGGADFIKILDNFYGSTFSGSYKIYYRGYGSVFPMDVSESTIPWVEYSKALPYPQGHIDRTTENYFQIKMEEVSGSGAGIGNQATRLAHATNKLGDYPYQITAGINGSGIAQVAGFMNSACPFGLNGNYYSYTFRSVIAPAGRTWLDVFAYSLATVWIDTESFIWVGSPNSQGMLGSNDYETRSASLFSPVANNSNFIQAALSSWGIVALKGDGAAWAWGDDNLIGDDRTPTAHALTPTSVFGGHTFISVLVVSKTAHGIDTDGQIWSWGSNTDLQCGRGGPYGSPAYVSYYGTPIKPIGGHSVSSFIGGRLYCDDYGNIFKLGTQINKYTEEGSIEQFGNIMDLGFDPASVVSIYYNQSNLAVHDTGGSIWRWGSSQLGQLGRNYIHNNTTTASIIMGGSVWRAYWHNGYCEFALRDDNTMWGWGSNYYYGIGTGSNNAAYSPIQTGGVQGWS
jgi:hypothetical protein